MNLLDLAPMWLAAILGVLLLAAAVEDAARLRISNAIVAGVIASALAAMAVEGLEPGLWQNALVFAGLLAAGTVLFGMGKMGGGDVKLIAAVGLWCDFATAVPLLASIFISGGVLALLILGARAFAAAGVSKRFAILRPSSGIPYGLAISAGSILMLLVLRL